MKIKNVDFTLHTDGSGLWSTHATSIQIVAIELDDNRWSPELLVYFKPNEWDVNQHGLIYTDKLFKKELREELAKLGMASEEIEYSEQGMQGLEFVSLDVDQKFVNSWI
jgi:hypothetical protein